MVSGWGEASGWVKVSCAEADETSSAKDIFATIGTWQVSNLAELKGLVIVQGGCLKSE